MKYFVLIWAGIWRKRTRTILTMLSVVIAFLLFGLLHGVNVAMRSNIDNSSASRLFTASKNGMTEGIPVSLTNEIAKVNEVSHVSHLTFFGGFYQDAKNAVPAYATEPSTYFAIYNELKVDPEALAKMERIRNGAVVGQPLADRFGWKVGDTVPIKTSIWTKKDGGSNYSFEIVGIYPQSSLPNMDQYFFINYEYLDESRSFNNGRVHMTMVSIKDPRKGRETSKAIDALFENSPHETYTQTETALVASLVKQMADIGFIVNSVVGAVLFTLLFLTGNTIMQSMRERIPEFAVLKTLGFSDFQVALFIVTESSLICVLSALTGLVLAGFLFGGVAASFGPVNMPKSVFVTGVGVAILLALCSGALPVYRSRHINIVDALAGR